MEFGRREYLPATVRMPAIAVVNGNELVLVGVLEHGDHEEVVYRRRSDAKWRREEGLPEFRVHAPVAPASISVADDYMDC